MKLSKAIFVTILVVVMLTAIDACLYALYNSGFIALTGAVIAYSVFRGAVDFCYWLCKSEPEPKHLAAKLASDEMYEPNEVYDRADDEESEDVGSKPQDVSKTASIMCVLSEDI